MIRKFFGALLLALGLFTTSMAAAAAPAATPSAAEAAEIQRLQALLDSLHPQTGVVKIASAKATLNLGEDYYFLNAEDSRRVLVDAWGNPPGSVEGVLGMVFPAGKSPVDETWGAVVTYVGDGYVSDADAKDIDYGALLDSLKEGEDADNRARQAEGFETVNLVGWAQQPSYDAQKHNLIWAKELAFGNTEGHTLNYDVRVLGRYGVLSMNIVSGMADLQTVGSEAARLMSTASFDAGARYTDYKEGVDKKAAYGIGGLVAGGAALAVAKKVGFLGVILLVLKKGWIVIAMGAVAAWRWFGAIFKGRKGGDFGGDRRAAAASWPEAADAPAPDAEPAPTAELETAAAEGDPKP
ncbi:DUF2167 domain-containing protein [Brevundimonas sp. Root1279]|uniref:DUF2167 domain-containing protein n=1 Tax=Brevundimonas sp. Root1279 TaxID=1736443 RepID=UPI0006F2FB8F|nr:DUF2167 domain-containing protein [Brevundimonas sp. Root1279]KQW81912.1 hypothetical protein ASC65_11545 [Brevundimonas sp. Root1279]